jgi:hypothetical protein
VVADLEHVAVQIRAGCNQRLLLGKLHIPDKEKRPAAIGEAKHKGVVVVVLFVALERAENGAGNAAGQRHRISRAELGMRQAELVYALYDLILSVLSVSEK